MSFNLSRIYIRVHYLPSIYQRILDLSNMEICCAYRPIILHLCMTMTKKASLKCHLFHRCAIKVLNDNKLEYGNDLLPSGAF